VKVSDGDIFLILYNSPGYYNLSKACFTSRKTDVQYSLFSNA
jgi:hypothetical protein